MKKITKAVIPAAGLGTRMLPIARTVPKEVLPIVDRPVMEYLVREAADSGITDILIITNRGKGAMEDYFDYSPEYEQKLIEKGKTKELEELRELVGRVNAHFIRQKEPRGLGHAISCARAFTWMRRPPPSRRRRRSPFSSPSTPPRRCRRVRRSALR